MAYPPLPERIRPKTLSDFVGQATLVGPKGTIRTLLALHKLPSMIFWGPPASGKTTLAYIISEETNSEFYQLSAVMDGKEELKKIIDSIKDKTLFNNETTPILFVDEIHRWNKAQQDALLPYVEKGVITLIGATTENPSFAIISPLLSRSRVFVFDSHTITDIVTMLRKGADVLGIQNITDSILEYIAASADGDMRFALNTLEIAHSLSSDLSQSIIEQAMQRSLSYDKNGEQHYNLISALHKSLRSSNPTAGVYWTMRMLQAGEDPLYVSRRMLRFASEDIGNINPNALLLANQVFDATRNLGMPECATALVQLAEYLAKSPKSNISYTAMKEAQKDILTSGSLPVPLHLRNAPTKLMKELEYGKGYEYDHNLPSKKSKQQCMPDGLKDRDYFIE